MLATVALLCMLVASARTINYSYATPAYGVDTYEYSGPVPTTRYDGHGGDREPSYSTKTSRKESRSTYPSALSGSRYSLEPSYVTERTIYPSGDSSYLDRPVYAEEPRDYGTRRTADRITVGHATELHGYDAPASNNLTPDTRGPNSRRYDDAHPLRSRESTRAGDERTAYSEYKRSESDGRPSAYAKLEPYSHPNAHELGPGREPYTSRGVAVEIQDGRSLNGRQRDGYGRRPSSPAAPRHDDNIRPSYKNSNSEYPKNRHVSSESSIKSRALGVRANDFDTLLPGHRPNQRANDNEYDIGRNRNIFSSMRIEVDDPITRSGYAQDIRSDHVADYGPARDSYDSRLSGHGNEDIYRTDTRTYAANKESRKPYGSSSEPAFKFPHSGTYDNYFGSRSKDYGGPSVTTYSEKVEKKQPVAYNAIRDSRREADDDYGVGRSHDDLACIIRHLPADPEVAHMMA
ncbi:PREDICTED: uncharacterized protein LOC106808607 [Priapulus caudatus]|uniref:Uncharacterized protein LOC106808607 n=1 Tax=Priapulus caudatus TaxID=37621 RepID=A0ABM1E3V2_PRICU|nr:PREDICTED: uncharacterized protein LOC106808607 [Priapulus caudatus]